MWKQIIDLQVRNDQAESDVSNLIAKIQTLTVANEHLIDRRVIT